MQKQSIGILTDIIVFGIGVSALMGLWLVGVKSFVTIGLAGGAAALLLCFDLIPVIWKKTRTLLAGVKPIHIAWVLLFLGILIWRVRMKNVMVSSPLDSAATFKFVCVALAGLISLASLLGSIARGLVSLHCIIPILLLLYGVTGIFSTLISPFTYFTLYKAVEMVVVATVLFATFARAKDSFKETKRYIDLTLFLYLLLLLTECISAIFKPDLAFRAYPTLFGYLFYGAFPHMDTDGLGFVSTIVTFSCMHRMLNADNRSEKKLYLCLGLFAMVLLFLVQARTSIFGFLAATLLVFFLAGRIKLLMFLAPILLLLLLFHSENIVQYFLRGSSEEMFLTMSGRTHAWQHAWRMFLKEPLLGYGFAATGFSIISMNAVGGMSVFNSFVECLVNSGVIGFIPWFIAFIATWYGLIIVFIRYRKKMKPAVKQHNLEMIGLMVILTARSLTASILTIYSLEFLIYMSIINFAQYNIWAIKHSSEEVNTGTV